MKIAFIVGQFPVLSETFILNQITGLLDRGHDVEIYASERGNTSKVHPSITQYNLLERTYYFSAIPDNLWLRLLKGISVFGNLLLRDPALAFKAINIGKYSKKAVSLWLLYTAIPLFNRRYDIIHCQFGHQGFRGIVFRDLHSPKAKLIAIFRGSDISSFVQAKGENVYQDLFKEGDFFLANCDFFLKKSVKIGCPPEKIVIHRSGLDLSKFTFKPRHFPSDGVVRIATTGRLVEKKGIEYAIRAVAKQIKSTPNIEYTVIGDGELRDKFNLLIDELELTGKIRLLGWRNEKEIVEILDRSHIFIAPSVTALDGNQDAPVNVLKEAMAMGLPVIATYHGGIPELVEDGVSGLLVPERDADAIAEKIAYLIDNPDLWLSMGTAGRKRVESDYDLDNLNDTLVEIYHKLLNNQKIGA